MDVISKVRNVIVCLQESKVSEVSETFLHSFAGSFLDKRVFIEANRASGDLITCWSTCIFSCQEVIICRYSITVLLTKISNGTKLFMTNVYGPATWEGKEDFYSELLQLKGSFVKESGCYVVILIAQDAKMSDKGRLGVRMQLSYLTH